MQQEMCAKLALACNILGAQGHTDTTLGHVSARFPGEDRVYMKPSGLSLDEVTAEDIVLIDFDGNKLEGTRKRHMEFPIHTEIYRGRPDVNCVVHTHPPYSTSMGASDAVIRPICHESVLFVGAPVFRQTTRLICNAEQGRAVVECLGNHRALLMQNHGVAVVGTCIEEATLNAILLERACQFQLLASGFGNLVWTPDEEVQAKVEELYGLDKLQGFFEYYARELKRQRSR